MATPSHPTIPAFGDELPLSPSPEVLQFLARRRSNPALTLTTPGPSDDQVRTLLQLAKRVPDHGKLAPWRFIIFNGPAKADFAVQIEGLALKREDARAAAKLGKLKAPPLAIAVISSPKPSDIPEWEQVLSAGAVCTNLLYGALAMGFGANWITDWYAYDPDALILLGLTPSEKVAGYILIGTTATPAQERERPELAALVRSWETP
ncbi:MAG: nitroreductase [Phenylobacterium zucineum]|nr:MAG: nitroreductase [Phenylobacterium zucineum]